MKRFVVAALLAALAVPAVAQNQSGPYFTNAPVGQTPGGISASGYAANNAVSGFTENALTTIVAAGSTQGTATLIPARTIVITACASGQGVQLPSLIRYTPITVMNRSGATCLVYPSPGATVETALGTNGAINAPNTQASNTDVVYRAISATQWLQ